MATIVIGEWTDKYQQALEHFRDLVVERKLRELKEEREKTTATKQGE